MKLPASGDWIKNPDYDESDEDSVSFRSIIKVVNDTATYLDFKTERVKHISIAELASTDPVMSNRCWEIREAQNTSININWFGTKSTFQYPGKLSPLDALRQAAKDFRKLHNMEDNPLYRLQLNKKPCTFKVQYG